LSIGSGPKGASLDKPFGKELHGLIKFFLAISGDQKGQGYDDEKCIHFLTFTKSDRYNATTFCFSSRNLTFKTIKH